MEKINLIVKKFLLFVAFVALISGHVVPAQHNQPAPGKDEDPPNKPNIINENKRASTLLLPKTSTKTLRLSGNRPASASKACLNPSALNFGKPSGDPELLQTFFVDSKYKFGFVLPLNNHCKVKMMKKFLMPQTDSLFFVDSGRKFGFDCH